MYDRLIRHELFESERYLDLHSDTARLALISLLPLADDFGNLPGSTRRLWRWLAPRTSLKTEADVAKVLAELMDVDLLRGYTVAGAAHLHLPGFKSTRSYVTRLSPPSPWCDGTARVGSYVAGMRARRAAASPVASRSQENTKQINGAGAGSESGFAIEVGVKEEKREGVSAATRLPAQWQIPPAWVDWALAFAHDQRHDIDRSDVLALADQFRDFWRSKAGAAGRKVAWLPAWRIWFRAADLAKLTRSSSPTDDRQVRIAGRI